MPQGGSSKRTSGKATVNSQVSKAPKERRQVSDQASVPCPSPGPKSDQLISQQRIANLFAHVFADALSAPDFEATLQAVKQALFERAFDAAFDKPQHLLVYAARWSPTRAMGYHVVLRGLVAHLPTPVLKAICIGGGPAELAALAAYLHDAERASADITLLDAGPWGDVVQQLKRAIVARPPAICNAGAAAVNKPTVDPERLALRFVRQDVLGMEAVALADLLAHDRPVLVTMLFTLNELFTLGGTGMTTKFLLQMTSVLPVGSLLLVVDSSGSYAEISLGQERKRYPMHWLLDRILLSHNVETRRWRKLEGRESVWFRHSSQVRYPIQLEHMRYQMHLYRIDETSQG